MISRQFISIFKSFLILTGLGIYALPVFAQNDTSSVQDTLEIYTSDTAVVLSSVPSAGQLMALDSMVRKKQFLSGVELAIDYGKLLLLWTDFESKYEGGINIRFYERIVLAAEMGYDELNPLKAYDNALYYTVKGSYARVGLDYYTSYNPTSFYFAGFRYGMSTFEDEGAFLIDSDYWENYEDGFGSTGITATWGEIILGTETFLNIGKKKPDTPDSKLLIGWKFRLRILGNFENREEPTIYSIPGYGRTFDSRVPALNLYIKYRIGH